MQESAISVAIVDDHSMLRQGLKTLLSENNKVFILFDARDGLDLQKKIRQYGTPEVVLMDINMPVIDGFEATRWIKSEYPQVHVLALSMDNGEENIIRMIRCGAGGYLLKSSTIDEVLKGITTISHTGIYFNEHISNSLLKTVRKDAIDIESEAMQLTIREKELLFYSCSELTYKQIALKMNISVNTLKNYRDGIGAKLDIKSRVGMVLYAIKSGIVKVKDLPDL